MQTHARCDSVRKVLHSLKGTSSFHKHAHNQAMCLENILKFMSLSAEEVSVLACKITEIGFPIDIECRVMESLKLSGPEKIAITSFTPRRNALQNYEGFIHFLQAAQWKRIEAAEGIEQLKILINFLIKLGLRHPSCPTYGMLTAIYSVLQDGETMAMEQSKMKKWYALENVKRLFKSFAADASDPVIYVLKLPESVPAFVKMYPSLASESYAGDNTCAHTLEVAMVRSIAYSWPLRKPKSDGSGHVMGDSSGDMFKSCIQAFMKMAQPRRESLETKIDFYDNRLPMTSALKSGPLALGDRIEDGVRVAGTTPLALVDKADAKADGLVKTDVSKADDSAVDKIGVTMLRDDLVDKAKDTAPRYTTASILKALLDRETEKKKDDAEKRRETRVLKRPAMEPVPSLAKKGKHSIPPLGCSKCRYLHGGCGVCIRRRVELIHKKK